jgi:hypothetical protein
LRKAVPQFMQNLAFSGFAEWQFGQFILIVPTAKYIHAFFNNPENNNLILACLPCIFSWLTARLVRFR